MPRPPLVYQDKPDNFRHHPHGTDKERRQPSNCQSINNFHRPMRNATEGTGHHLGWFISFGARPDQPIALALFPTLKVAPSPWGSAQNPPIHPMNQTVRRNMLIGSVVLALE